MRFFNNSRGATAAELALIAAPLLFLIFATLELSLIFILQMNLANAASTLGREIRVGQIVASGSSLTTSNGTQLDLADFKSQLCSNIQIVPKSTCLNQLQVDVRTQTSFSSLTPPSPISGGTFNATTLCFNSGAASSVVEFNAYYLWPVLTPGLLNSLANVKSLTTSNGTSTGTWFAISAADVFRNEPNNSIVNTSSSC